MKKYIFITGLLLVHGFAMAWTGNVDNFLFIADTINLNAPAVASQAYVADTCSAFYNASWRATFRFDYAPSSSNYCKWYVMSDAEALDAGLNGYFIRVGYTNKNIAFCAQNGTKSEVLAQGDDNRVVAEEPLAITVERSETGDWLVWSKLESETDSVLELEVTSATFSVNHYSGFLFKYTSTRSTAFHVWGYSHKGRSFNFNDHLDGSVWVEPQTFTPDGDGVDELAYIYYKLSAPSVANIYIYSVSGALVRQLAKDVWVEEQGVVTWDGYSGRGLLMNSGIYVVVFESVVDGSLSLRRKIPFVLGVK